MQLITSSRAIRRQLFQIVYSTLVPACLLWLAVAFQAGNSGIYLFLRNDLLTEPQRLIFVLGFPTAYLVSLLILSHTLKLPRFDFFNRILAINVVVYSFLGLTLSALRLPLVSREVFVSEFLLSSASLIIYHISRHRLFPRHLGVLPEVDTAPFDDYPLLDSSPTDTDSIHNTEFDGIVANLRVPIDSNTSHLLADLAQKRIPVYDANVLLEALWGRVPLENLTPIEIETFTPTTIYSRIKRISELSLIIICAPLLVILATIISIAIKLDSSGSVVFNQPRTGLNGKSFTLLKFRSMIVTHQQENRFAEKKDKRITRVGRVLRRSRLDELPQLWNVLKGDMSLIGPRPEQLEFTKQFDQLIPFYGFRHTIRPGVTGWAQVMYGYASSNEQTRAKLEFDFFYIKHMSAWLDVIILFKTIRTIILGSGAR
jgi:exopolysaccharide biosynthesis polyprenyl glycosylphosphotransferase